MAAPTIDGSNTYGSSAASSTHTIPLPASGVADGKLLGVVLCYGAGTGGGGILQNPSLAGWTILGDADELWNCGGITNIKFAYKVAGASESNPIFTFGNGTTHCAAVSMVFGGVGATPIDASAANDNDEVGGVTTLNAPTITTLGVDRLVLRLGGTNFTGTLSWATSSVLASAQATGTSRLLSVASFTQSGAGSTGAEAVSSATTGAFQTATIAIAPPSVPAAPTGLTATLTS
jgi:hypothetical protein